VGRYARAMEQRNQGPSAVPEVFVPAAGPRVDDDTARRARRGLAVWLGLLLVGGLGGLLLDQPEAAGLVALAGLFAAAQAADLDPLWRQAWEILAFVPPVGGVLFFGYLATVLLQSGLAPAPRVAGVSVASVGALVLGLSAMPAFAAGLARRLFGGAPSYALRFAAQLAAAGILLAVPAWFAFDALKETLLQNPEPLLAKAKLSGALIGYMLLALGGVGCWIRRDPRQTLDRLGLKPVTLRHAGVILAGALALFLLNAGAEAVQHRFFPGLWQLDHEVTKLLARAMTPGRVVLLGLSAGVGEEVTLRGGLQPKLGVVLTSLLFAALHVQYSWFGMVLVFTLGLALGLIRKYTSTTAAIIVHGLYDMLAVVTS
jgi:hypothetical protein